MQGGVLAAEGGGEFFGLGGLGFDLGELFLGEHAGGLFGGADEVFLDGGEFGHGAILLAVGVGELGGEFVALTGKFGALAFEGGVGRGEALDLGVLVGDGGVEVLLGEVGFLDLLALGVEQALDAGERSHAGVVFLAGLHFGVGDRPSGVGQGDVHLAFQHEASGESKSPEDDGEDADEDIKFLAHGVGERG